MKHTTDIVVFVSQTAPHPRLQLVGCVTHYFTGFDEFRKAALVPAAFVIKSDYESYVSNLLRQIRRDPFQATALIFIDGNVSLDEHPLSDGAAPATREELLNRIAETQQRARAMRARGDDQTPESLLLEYLWLRPGCIMEPQSDWKHPQRYYYPILEVLDRTDSDPEIWLQKMDHEGLLEKVALKDRQRECDFCGSAHLSFIDVCPHCRSIGIDQHTALHCFTCGLIAPEERFVSGNQRVCPKCGAQLRHIGTDYDRPLETCVCSSCDHVFVEGEVVARCAICAHSMPPTTLRHHKFYSWRLGANGRLAMQGGLESASNPDSVTSRNSREHFIASLDWMLKMMQTQSDLYFSLMGLRLINRVELEAALGSANAARLIEAYVDRLRELLNDADLMVRTDDENVLILLPHFDRKHIAKLRVAIKTLSKQARQQSSIGPVWDVADIQVNAKSSEKENTETLIARLNAAVGLDHSAAQAA